MNLVNIGCGSVFHNAWINLDLVPASTDVQRCDFRKGLPYPDNYFDACYSSHVFEHLKKQEAKDLIGECLRVLKPNGIIRLVVPDLETIARTYLMLLEQVESGLLDVIPNYDWIVLELYDQAVRSQMGGDMQAYLTQAKLSNESFIKSRIGLEYKSLLQKISSNSKRDLPEKIRSQTISSLFSKVKLFLLYLVIEVIAGSAAKQAFQEGLFRNSGEIHRWMYDRFSLRRLLEEAGFVDVRVLSADCSRIANFKCYELDTAGGQIRKPDSLFVEGAKR